MPNAAATQKLLESVASRDMVGAVAALDSGADLAAKDLSGHNVLALAVVHGSEDLALMMLGALVSARPGLEWFSDEVAGSRLNPLELMVVHQRHRVLAASLGLGDQVIERLRSSSSPKGGTIAHLAVGKNAARSLSLVLKACPDLAMTSSSSQISPLSLAIRADKEKLVEILLDAGANVLDELSPDPPWAQVGTMSMIDYLSEHVEWSEVRTSTGGSLTHVLVARGQDLKIPLWRAVHRRFPQHACVVDFQGRSPLHVAIRVNASVEVIDALVSSGASWVQQDQSGDTPLSLLNQQLSSGWEVEAGIVERWISQANAHALDASLAKAAPSSSPTRF